jgi:hypothetical protein
MPQPGPAIRPFEVRREQIDRVEALAGGVFRYCTSFAVHGAGEAAVDINFPVKFSELPNVSDGTSLKAGSVVEEGNMPHGHACVLEWQFDGADAYIGATVGLVMYGSDDQDALIHLGVEGKALQAPFPTS